jgi:transposase
MVYVGVDLHRKRSHVVALDRTGEVVLSRRIGNAPAEFWRIFGELEPGPIEVVFEATYGWSWFADLLADAGIAAHMAHPLATKAISAARVKNDAVDAKTLAHLLRTNLLAEAWIAPPAAREARRLVRTRAGLVRMRSRVQSQLHALLADLGVIPELTTLFGPVGRRWLAELDLPVAARGRLDAGLRLIDAITVEVKHADADLRTQFAGDPRIRRLLPIPGIGLVTAATVVAEVWEIGRFPAPERLCSWAGLTPGSAPATPIPAAATSPSRVRAGCAGCWSRRPPPPSAIPTSAASPSRSPSAAGPRSPGWHWPGGCSPCATTRYVTRVAVVPTPPPRGRSRQRGPGALGVCHGLAVQRPPA